MSTERIIGNRYELRQPLGEGGMGAVYAGYDRTADRPVAIKQLKTVFAAPEILTRFRREGEALRALDHPNIVKLLDSVDEDGQHYLVMEFVDGGDLSARLQRGPLPLSDVLEIALQLSDALTRAHYLDIIHRDLKPANVLLTQLGTVRLTDFGVAHLPAQPRLTSTNAVVGTIHYLAPEALLGEGVDQQSDLWALGVILFEMLTGKRPFDGATVHATMLAILNERPPDLASLNPAAPPALVTLVDGLLQRERSQRIPSARHVGAVLEDVLTGRSTPPAGTSTRRYWPTPSPPAGRPLPEQAVRHTPVDNLPAQTTSFIGRDRERQRLQKLLLRDEIRLVTLTGVGGTGKTRLSLAVAADLRGQFADGIFFVDLAPVRDPELVAAAIVATLGINDISNEPASTILNVYLRDRELLLLLDNYEQVIAAAALTTDLLRAAPRLKLIVTSREVLQVYGEHEFAVPPLALPAASTLSVDDLAASEAVQLFVQRAQAAQSRFELTDDNRAAVVAICRRLDGLPLAIELAAARVKLFAPAALLGRLESGLQILRSPRRDIPSRQQTLRAAINWSYELLTAAEQTLLLRLSVFRGGRGLEAVEVVCGDDLDMDVIDGLMSLLNKSLLRRHDDDQGEPRFTMLETIQEFAADQLRQSGETNIVAQRHCEYFLQLAEAAAAELRGPNSSLWIDRLDVERDNLEAALSWSLDDGAVDLGARLVVALRDYWLFYYQHVQGERWCERAVSVAARLNPWLRAWVYCTAGIIAIYRPKSQRAKGYLETAVELAELLGDAYQIAVANMWLAASRYYEHRFEESHAMALAALAVFEEGGNHPEITQALNILGEGRRLFGDLDAAADFYLRAIEMGKKTGEQRRVAMQYFNLGMVAAQRQDVVDAAAQIRAGLPITFAIRLHEVTSNLLTLSGWVLARSGEPELGACVVGAGEGWFQRFHIQQQVADAGPLDRLVGEVKAAVPADRYAELWLAGTNLSLPEAADLALPGLARVLTAA